VAGDSVLRVEIAAVIFSQPPRIVNTISTWLVPEWQAVPAE
jgi:hypothetical protein